MRTEGLAATEAECAEGRTAPRVSLAESEANIAFTSYIDGYDVVFESHMIVDGHGRKMGADFSVGEYGAGLNTLTIALMVLRNGFTIIGKSAPASAANFDAELGRKLAYEDAVRQVWPLMGYELRERLHRQGTVEPEEQQPFTESGEYGRGLLDSSAQ